MADEQIAPATAESAEPQQTTLEAEFDKALVEHPIPEAESKSATTEQPGQATPPEGQAAEEPEHLKWVKSQSGFVDPATGQVNLEAVAKQAYELNRYNQTTAQNLNQLGALLRHPKIAAAMQEVVQGIQPPQAGQQPAGEQPDKSEEEILAEFIQSKIDATIGPVQQQAAYAYQQFESSQMQLAYQQLKNDFGTTKIEGKDVSVYDTIAGHVDQQILAEAANVGATVPQYMSYLIRSGQLYPKYNTLARAVLFPTLQQRNQQAAVQTQQTNLEKQKRTTLTGKTSTPAVRTGNKKVSSFADAVAAAEEELAQKQ